MRSEIILDFSVKFRFVGSTLLGWLVMEGWLSVGGGLSVGGVLRDGGGCS